MAKKNEIIVKDVSIKTMNINGDNKGVEFVPLRKTLEIDGVRFGLPFSRCKYWRGTAVGIY